MLQLRAVPNVLTQAQCDRLIERHAGELSPSLVTLGSSRVRHHAMRSSSSAKLAALPDDVRAELEPRLMELSGLPSSHAERWELIRYQEGERFVLHHDMKAGQDNARRCSVIVYLRAPIAGGETAFPLAQTIVQPRAGLLVCWRNTTPDGAQLAAAAHASRPVLQGEKWCLVTWVCERPCEPCLAPLR